METSAYHCAQFVYVKAQASLNEEYGATLVEMEKYFCGANGTPVMR